MTGLQKLSRIGAWLVLLVGLALALAYALGWSDAVARMITPELGDSDQSNSFAGLALYGIVGATLPFFLALWALWHLQRLLRRYAVGDTMLARHDASIVGLALMAIALTLVIAGALLGLNVSGRFVLAILPAHIVTFAAGAAVLIFARWRPRLVS
jgi:hypothetical protein